MSDDRDIRPDGDGTLGEIDPYGMTCAELVELVTDYVEGALSMEHRARIDAHLAVCPPCLHVIDQWRTVIALTGALGEEHADRLAADQRAELTAAFRAAAR
jgi:anti-sigma factor RsiW